MSGRIQRHEMCGHTERSSEMLASISSIIAAGTMRCGDSQRDMPATMNADRPKPAKPRTAPANAATNAP